ncbi:MAG: serine protease [Bacteroidota bacterium]
MERNLIYILLFSLLSLPFQISAQITQLGEIRNKDNVITRDYREIPTIHLPTFDIEQLRAEDKSSEDEKRRPFRFAKGFDVSIDIKKKGIREQIPNYGSVWILGIRSAEAFSLNVIFGTYELPPGAELFIYNKKQSQIVGALTSRNNSDAKVLPVQPIVGDEIIVEYFEPSHVPFEGKLIISRVGHDYVGFLCDFGDYIGYCGTPQTCNRDISCSEGDDWQDESHSVCRIIIDGIYCCSGSLINNVDNDGTAYVLTADHCINSSYEATNSVFLFGYRHSTCGGTGGSTSNTISGATLRGNWDDSDFALVELSSVPPANFHPYWNGWDNSSDTPAEPVVCVHHPVGDVKKISVDDSDPSDNGDFWEVTDWNVGTVEHGSSGAPFYDSDHRVVGQVHGGNNIFCSSNETSEYGKFSVSWDGNGTNATRLQNWLDPANTTTELSGLRLVQNSTIDSNTPVTGDIVVFDDITVSASAAIGVEFEERFEATGTLNVPVGTTLSIEPE